MLNKLLARTNSTPHLKRTMKISFLLEIKEQCNFGSIATNTWVYILTNIVARLPSQSGGSYNNYTCCWALHQIISLVHFIWWENMIDNPDNVIGSTPHCLDLNCDQI